MSKRTIILGTVFFIIVFAANGCMKKQQDMNANDLIPKTVSDKQTYSGSEYLGDGFLDKNPPPVDQELVYLVRGKYDRSITQERLKKSNSIHDIISDYPGTMITDYTSVEVLVSSKGKTIKALSPSHVLSQEQKDLFASAGLATELEINVNYKNINAATDAVDNRQMRISMTVVPEIEAEYIGGYDKMIAWLTENGNDDISARNRELLQQTSVFFTINKDGKVSNVNLSKTTGVAEIDKSLVELILNMPKWKPAENPNGSFVEQEFEFIVGQVGC
ncbi:MAG: energy transducer TonB [Bacteroidales bacterium]|nr:energy transducer TonB [Bacteroidales bacterium]MCF8455811.1 energy transducer TonB [Bacteroidales bacterium]